MKSLHSQEGLDRIVKPWSIMFVISRVTREPDIDRDHWAESKDEVAGARARSTREEENILWSGWLMILAIRDQGAVSQRYPLQQAWTSWRQQQRYPAKEQLITMSDGKTGPRMSKPVLCFVIYMTICGNSVWVVPFILKNSMNMMSSTLDLHQTLYNASEYTGI